MEIFGIPVFIIFICVIWAWSNYTDQQKKDNEQIAKKWGKVKKEIAEKWDAITIGMSIEDVFEKLGKPNRVVEMGAQEEAWGYGPNSSYVEIMFIEGRI